jgi:hypothetical protein
MDNVDTVINNINTIKDSIGIVAAVLPLIAIGGKQRNRIFRQIKNLIRKKNDLIGKTNDIEIEYNETTIWNHFLSILKIKYKGDSPIIGSNDSHQIKIYFDKEILDCMVKENNKKVQVVPTINSKGYLVECKFDLLKTGEYFTLLFVSLERLCPMIIFNVEDSPKIISEGEFSNFYIILLVFLYCIVLVSTAITFFIPSLINTLVNPVVYIIFVTILVFVMIIIIHNLAEKNKNNDI